MPSAATAYIAPHHVPSCGNDNHFSIPALVPSTGNDNQFTSFRGTLIDRSDSCMISAFRRWVAALRVHMCVLDIPEGKFRRVLENRAIVKIGIAERAVFEAPVGNDEDMAALAWVMVHVFGAGGCDAYPADLRTAGDLEGGNPMQAAMERLHPGLAAITKGNVL